jgi:hypothetical protein
MSTDEMIGGPISKGAVAATLLDHEDHVLTAAQRESLWEIFVEIGRCWGNFDDDSASIHSSWAEFIEAKTQSPPSYIGEYANAVVVVQELVLMYGKDQAFTQLFLHSGVPDGPPTTRLAHVKRYVIDEFIRVQIVAGGFKGFVTPSPINYNGYIGGSRYNRLSRVTPYVPGLNILREEK